MKRRVKMLMAILMSLVVMSGFPCMPVPVVHAGRTIYNNETGTDGGYNYELWKDYGTTSMNLNDGGTFGCSWSNIGNALFRKGKKFDSTQKYNQLGNISIDYGCTYNPSGNSYLCVYGWTKNPLVEYYIVESWGSWRPPGASPKGQINVDGGTYDVYETTRVNQPSIEGNTTFQQYWSVRTSKRTSGTISVSEHFKKWESMGMQMGNMYEVALNVEGYQSSGNANVYKNDIKIGGNPTPTQDPTPSNVPNKRSAFTTIEAEQYNAKNSSTMQEIGTTNGGKGIGYIENGNTLTYKNIDFGNGASKLTAMVATQNDTTIQIRSGSANGALLGTLNVGSTGGWDNYREVSTNISNISGVKDVVLVFSGAVNIDNFVFSGSGVTPTPTPTPVQGGKSAFSTIQAEDYDSNQSSTMEKIGTSNGGSGIGYIENGNTATYKNINFGEGATSFTANLATNQSSSFEVRLDNAYGTLLGTLSTNSTGGWDNYQNVSTNINKVTGIHDVVLVFAGAVNIDSFVFGGQNGGGNGGNNNPPTSATLLNTYGSLFGHVGTCINLSQLQDQNTLNVLKQQYNSITLENEMKPDSILGSSANLISVQEAKNLGYYIPSNYSDSMVPRLNFNTVDKVMQICSQNGIKMRAHTLVWHSQTPNWLFRQGFNGGSSYVSPSVMDARQEFYVKSMINHVYNSAYGNCVYAWDVANEHLHASNSGWAGVYGNGKNMPFIKNGFRFANDALVALGKRDSVKLFYNDYNTYEVADDIVSLVNYINTDGKHCDGVGMQAHLDTSYPSADKFKDTMQKFLKAGFEVQVTELDVTNTSESVQADYYYKLMSSILQLKKAGGNITGITLWGMYDSISWRASQSPLLFSSLTSPKQSYNSVLKAYTDAGYSVGAVK